MVHFKAFRLFQASQGDAPEGRFVTMTENELTPGSVLIKNAFSSINYKDALAAAGKNKIIREFPRIGGIDVTGEVVRSSDPRFAAGDAVVVHGFGIGVDLDGGHAEYTRVSGDFVLKIPEGLSLFDAAAIGVAGYTAALALHAMEHNGLVPQNGPVLVTGATGGVAGMAIDMLATRGYSVTAMSGKAAATEYLQKIGARNVIAPEEADAAGKPLEAPRWAGVVDSIGGGVLSWILRTMRPEGVVTSFGNAGGAAFDGSVLPFILRGVKLLGINGNSPMALRRDIWARIATDYRPRQIQTIARTIAFEELPDAMSEMLARRTIGRTVVRF